MTMCHERALIALLSDHSWYFCWPSVLPSSLAIIIVLINQVLRHKSTTILRIRARETTRVFHRALQTSAASSRNFGNALSARRCSLALNAAALVPFQDCVPSNRARERLVVRRANSVHWMNTRDNWRIDIPRDESARENVSQKKTLWKTRNYRRQTLLIAVTKSTSLLAVRVETSVL